MRREMIRRSHLSLKPGGLYTLAMEDVDLALILALDGSASVTFEEFGLMAGGCGSALRDPEIVTGLTGGPLAASQCALVLWSGLHAQEVMVEWTRIDSQATLQAFADAVENVPRTVRAGATAIGEALLVCEQLLANAAGRRAVIDMVGDGRSNEGAPPGPIRDRLAGAGVTINGLCVLHEEADLLASYEQEVIGGPGAFALPCPDYTGFAEAMRQKLRKEIASARPNRLTLRA
jgi:Ca-activated chloride channel homolog